MVLYDQYFMKNLFQVILRQWAQLKVSFCPLIYTLHHKKFESFWMHQSLILVPCSSVCMTTDTTRAVIPSVFWSLFSPTTSNNGNMQSLPDLTCRLCDGKLLSNKSKPPHAKKHTHKQAIKRIGNITRPKEPLLLLL